MNKEVKASIIRKEESNIGIIGLLIDDCDYGKSYFKSIQIGPLRNGRLLPIDKWENQAECWRYIKDSIEIGVHNSITQNPVFNYTLGGMAEELSPRVKKQFLPEEIQMLDKSIEDKINYKQRVKEENARHQKKQSEIDFNATIVMLTAIGFSIIFLCLIFIKLYNNHN